MLQTCHGKVVLEALWGLASGKAEGGNWSGGLSGLRGGWGCSGTTTEAREMAARVMAGVLMQPPWRCQALPILLCLRGRPAVTPSYCWGNGQDTAHGHTACKQPGWDFN